MMKKSVHRLLIAVCCVTLVLMFAFSAFAQEKTQFKIWFYERDNAMSTSWHYALEQFQKKHPDVEVVFELKTFEDTQTTALMVLNSDEAPDVMQINKGNATAGLYAKEGLLENLEAVAKERGWDNVMSPSIQATCRYNEQGLMGTGDLWGITTYGEFVMVYYNKDMFAKYGLKVPTTLEEFEQICDSFVEKEIIPIALAGADQWPSTHNWFELVLYKADRDLANKYQMVATDVDLKGPAFKFGTEKFVEYIKKGYFDPNVTGIDYDTSHPGFYAEQKYAMMLTGSWLYKVVIDNAGFDWDVFLMPGKTLNTGSGGNLFVVPKNAKQKELAYDFLDLVLGEEAQTVMAEAGGIPLNADVSAIEDPKTQRLNELFNGLVKTDGLAFYPDWPVPNFMEVLGGGLQMLLSGSDDVDGFLDSISYEYDSGKE
jgi:raffinose/stachyose/melibiose transport system substrate-binding protein